MVSLVERSPLNEVRSGERAASVILWLLFGCLLLSYADRAAFALSLKPIKAALSLSDVQLGLLSGLAFAATYAIFGPITGWFGDHFPRKAVLITAVAIWSAATAATAFAGDYPKMFIARSVVGFGEAAVMPLAVSLITDARADNHLRNRAFAIFLTSPMIGQALALLFGGALYQWLPAMGGLQPWQSVFVLAGCLGVLAIVVIALTMKEPPRGAKREEIGKGGALSFITANARLALSLFVGFSFLQLAYVTALAWVLVAIERGHGWSAGVSGVRFALTAGPLSTIGSLVTVQIIRRLRRNGHLLAPMFTALFCATAFTTFLVAGLATPNGTLSMLLIAIAFFFGPGPTVCIFSIMGEAMPPSSRARLAGVNTLANAAICNTLGSYLVGLFSDHVFKTTGGISYALIAVDVLALIVGALTVASGFGDYRRLLGASGGVRAVGLTPATVTSP